jgi:purine-binding chemotaxis protein CheW
MTRSLHQREPQRRPVDWQALHARLRDAVEKASVAGRFDEHADQTRLAERARQFAQLPEVQGPPTERIDVLEFELGRERIAVAACFVATVQALRVLTPLPRTPPHIRGIADVRGNLIAVLDLGLWLQLPRRGITQLDRLIVLQAQTRQIAVLADCVAGVRSLERARVRQYDHGSGALSTVDGAGSGGNRLLLVDVEHLLASSDLLQVHHSHGLSG